MQAFGSFGSQLVSLWVRQYFNFNWNLVVSKSGLATTFTTVFFSNIPELFSARLQAQWLTAGTARLLMISDSAAGIATIVIFF
jgi:hypothetical protein